MAENVQRVNRLGSLEALRGVAALALVLFHTRAMPPLQVPAQANFVLQNLAFGVPLFYAISAFSLFQLANDSQQDGSRTPSVPNCSLRYSMLLLAGGGGKTVRCGLQKSARRLTNSRVFAVFGPGP